MAEVNHTTYIRKPFEVEAVQVTEENLEAVRDWCNGALYLENEDRPYIKVWVARALNERQTKAYPEDWVLYAGTGFKVYTDRAFRRTFFPKVANPNQYDNVPMENTKNTPEAVTPYHGS